MTLRQRRPDLYRDNPSPCPRCLRWWKTDQRGDWGKAEMVQPLAKLAPALARDGSGPCCHDCQAADTLHQLLNVEPSPPDLEALVKRVGEGFRPVPFTERCEEQERGPHRSTMFTWPMLRLAVGNDRREQYRLPGAPMGLIATGCVSASAAGDLELHHAWAEQNGLWGEEDEDE